MSKKLTVVRRGKPIPAKKLVTASQAKVIANKAVRSASETKYIDGYLFTNNAIAPVIYTGVIANLMLLPPGDLQGQHIGQQVDLLGMRFRFNCGIGTPTSCNFRILLVTDKDNTLTTPGQYLEDISSADRSPLSPLNYNFRDDFIVHYDTMFSLDSGKARNKVWTKYIKINKKMKYLNNSATCVQNAPKLLMFNDADTTANAPMISFSVRSYYKDQ